MILMVKKDPDGDLRGSLSIPPKIFGGRIGDFVMDFKIPQDVREWIGDVFRSERNKQSGDEMTFPRLEIRTRQETGRLHSDLTFGDRTFHGIGGSVVDLVTTMATDPNIPKEIKDWIGDTFWTENEKLKEQAGSLVDERDRLEAENEDLKAKFCRVVGENEKVRTEIRCLRGDMEAGSEQIIRLEAENGRLQTNQILELQAQITKLEAENAAKSVIINQSIPGLEDERDRLEAENGRLKEAIERQTNQILDLQAQITKVKTENRRTVYIRENAEIERQAMIPLLKEIARLEDETKQKDDEINTLRAQRDKAHALNVEIQGLKDRIANFQDEAIDSDTLIGDLEIKIGEANRQILSLETDNATLRAKLEKVPSTPLEEAHRTIDLLLNRLTQ